MILTSAPASRAYHWSRFVMLEVDVCGLHFNVEHGDELSLDVVGHSGDVSWRAAVGRSAGTGMMPPAAVGVSQRMRRTTSLSARNSANAGVAQRRWRCWS